MLRCQVRFKFFFTRIVSNIKLRARWNVSDCVAIWLSLNHGSILLTSVLVSIESVIQGVELCSRRYFYLLRIEQK